MILHKAGQDELLKASEIIKAGGLVAFPTETVYGLGASVYNDEALGRIYKVKGRPADNPLIVHIEDASMLGDIAYVNESASRLADMYWPGPLTVILKKKPHISMMATGGRDTVAVRVPEHEIARKLINLAGVPIAAPSANTSGRPSPTEAEHVARDLCGKIDMILDGGSVKYGLESTIVDLSGKSAEILRPGAITKEMIISVLGAAEYITDTSARAPGTKYRHYAPHARAVLADTGERGTFSLDDTVKEAVRIAESAYDGRCGVIGIMSSRQTADLYDKDKYTILCVGDRSNPDTVAAGLYGTLRRFDELAVEMIICEAYPEDGIGAAIMNRLRKACANEE